MKKCICCLLSCLACCFVCLSQNVDRDRVERAVRMQLAEYPNSTLCDIYKSFFQDCFGPGHLIADSAKAVAYLRKELESGIKSRCPLYELLPYQGNFYRVSLEVISTDKVPFDVFAEAFLKSAREFRSVDGKQWVKQWREIENYIRQMGLPVKNYDNDVLGIENMFMHNCYIMHHSEQFNSSYKPSYRIISVEVFEKDILPLLK